MEVDGKSISAAEIILPDMAKSEDPIGLSLAPGAVNRANPELLPQTQAGGPGVEGVGRGGERGGGGGSAFYRAGADGVLRQVYMLERLGYGHKLTGPAIIMNGSSTVGAPFPLHPSPPSCAQKWAREGGDADRYRAWMRC